MREGLQRVVLPRTIITHIDTCQSNIQLSYSQSSPPLALDYIGMCAKTQRGEAQSLYFLWLHDQVAKLDVKAV